MAITLFEGFDTLTTAQVLGAYPNSLNYSGFMTSGRFGGQAFVPGPSNQNGQFGLGLASLQSMTVGAAVYLPAVMVGGAGGGGVALFRVNGADGAKFRIGINNSGAVMVGNDTSLTLATSAAGVITGDNYHYWEFELFIHATLGSIRVLIDGVVVINLTGVNTRGFGSVLATAVLFSMSGTGQGGMIIDDVYLKDDIGALGPQRVETLRPTGDSSVAWTPNAGANNYSRVGDTVSDGDTTYVSASTPTTLDRYSLADLSDTPATISAVAPVMVARMTDAGPRSLRCGVRSGSSDSWGAAQAMTAGYVARQAVFALDPATSAAWTPAAVNALLAQVEVV